MHELNLGCLFAGAGMKARSMRVFTLPGAEWRIDERCKFKGMIDGGLLAKSLQTQRDKIAYMNACKITDLGPEHAQ